MTKLERDLVIECLKEYEICGKVTVKAVEKVLSELVDSKEHMTNADSIREMSDEQLTDFLTDVTYDVLGGSIWLETGWKNWLLSEKEE